MAFMGVSTNQRVWQFLSGSLVTLQGKGWGREEVLGIREVGGEGLRLALRAECGSGVAAGGPPSAQGKKELSAFGTSASTCL